MIAASNKPIDGTVTDVCSDYLCELCPIELLEKTNHSLGPCQKVHSDEARQIYKETLVTDPQVSVIEAHKQSLRGILSRRDKKVEQGLARLAIHAAETDDAKSMETEIDDLELEINNYVLKRDNLSIDEVNNNLATLKELSKQQGLVIDRIRLAQTTPTTGAERHLAVCPMCACYINVNMSDKRKSIHEQHAAHQVYQKIESRLAEFEKNL